MKKIVSEPRLIGMVIVAIGVVLLVLGIAAEMSGGGERIDGPPGELPEARNYYILIGVPTIIVGGLIAFIAARRSDRDKG